MNNANLALIIMKELNQSEISFVKAICDYNFEPFNDTSSKEYHIWASKGRKETRNLINCLENAVNYFGFEAKPLVEEIKKDKNGYSNLVQLSYEWIELWSQADNYRTDPRNEASTALCKKIASALISHDEFVTQDHFYIGLKESVFVMHKTLVQTATSIFVTTLRDENRCVKNLLNNKDKDIHLPMI